MTSSASATTSRARTPHPDFRGEATLAAGANLEVMTLGPRLPDERQSLVMVSDINFTPGQPTQVLLSGLPRGR